MVGNEYAKGIQAAASDWWLYRWFVKWKTMALTAVANCISCCRHKYLTCNLSFTQQIRSIPESLANDIRQLGTSDILCGKGKLRKWGTLYNLAEMRTPRDGDNVQCVLQMLQDHEQRTHPAGTRFVTHDTLWMCVCLTSSAAITMVTMLSLTPSVLHERAGPEGCCSTSVAPCRRAGE